jgi:hypothetical protein
MRATARRLIVFTFERELACSCAERKKVSDRGARRGGCAAGLRGAAAVTCGAVRCTDLVRVLDGTHQSGRIAQACATTRPRSSKPTSSHQESTGNGNVAPSLYRRNQPLPRGPRRRSTSSAVAISPAWSRRSVSARIRQRLPSSPRSSCRHATESKGSELNCICQNAPAASSAAPTIPHDART